MGIIFWNAMSDIVLSAFGRANARPYENIDNIVGTGKSLSTQKLEHKLTS